MEFNEKPEGIRVIKTARTVEEMNRAVLEGYWPLLYQNSYDKEVNEYLMMYQHPETQLCQIVKDPCVARELEALGYKPRLKNSNYISDSPLFAAYLIPKDIKQEEEVWLEDVIEVGYRNYHRVTAAKGVWKGSSIRFENDWVEKPNNVIKISLEDLLSRSSQDFQK